MSITTFFCYCSAKLRIAIIECKYIPDFKKKRYNKQFKLFPQNSIFFLVAAIFKDLARVTISTSRTILPNWEIYSCEDDLLTVARSG